MREGVNPEKYKSEKNKRFCHRIIIPIYIPNTYEEYYRDSINVLKICLNSLFLTINGQTSAITLINNNSCDAVDNLLNKYYREGLIEKYIKYKNNKGKVYPVQSEAKASFEPFITVADADILFISGWEQAVFKIFKSYNRAGVVAPLPCQNLAFNKNCSIFFDNCLNNSIGYEKVVDDKDCEIFLQGMGNSALHKRNNRAFSWKEKQYFINEGELAILGAGHFVATYRREIFNFNNDFPNMKFQNNFEELYFDGPADHFGWYRLSTPKTYAYHIGNKTDIFSQSMTFRNKFLDEKLVSGLTTPSKSKIPYFLKSTFFRILKRIKKL